MQENALRAQLAQEIAKVVPDEQIIAAFEDVPRHIFVPSFYDRLAPGKREWRQISSTENEEIWMQEVYTNRPLTTAIDSHGYPVCSSSLPTIMAQMLQVLHLKPDSRVLEIGTGTGYNAALLAHIVGPKNVVSIDINDALLKDAHDRIAQTTGGGVLLIHMDGRDLSRLGTFDAIVVTAATTCFVPSWLNAMAPGGRLLFNWNTSLTKAMIVLNQQDGSVQGQVCPFGGDFMLLQDGNGYDFGMPPKLAFSNFSEELDLRKTITDPDVKFFLRVMLPNLVFHRYRTGKEPSYALQDEKTDRMVHFYPTRIKGDLSLYQEIREVLRRFDLLHRPLRTVFHVKIKEDGSMIFYPGDRS